MEKCYRNCFILTKENKIRNIAFPSISTGICGYSILEASLIAIQSAKRYEKEFDQIVFCCFSKQDFKVYNKNK